MSGHDLADAVRAKRSDTKVLFTSGYADEAVAINGVLESGAEFLQKPLTPDLLLRGVREVLSSDAPVAVP